MKLFKTLFSCALSLSIPAFAGPAIAVSADDAQVAVAQGAFVLDVRPAQQQAAGHLPQAVALPAQAADWALPALAALLSQAGVDSSRTLLIVGQAGDAQAQALWRRLAQVSSGRVLWLVGGVQEWQMRGYALHSSRTPRPPVPQFLAPFQADLPVARMAGSRIRSTALLERDEAVRVVQHVGIGAAH
jgi:rhodanese-related sulfurtransferase